MNKVLLLIIAVFIYNLNLNSQTNNTQQKPKLVVQLVVEQMRYDLLQRYWDRFSEKGFKQLITQGAFCKNATYDYMITESAPGYATIATGANPSGHGIVSEQWYVRLLNKEQFCIADDRLPNRNFTFNINKYSPKHLIGSTFGDELRVSNYKLSKVISIGISNQASVLLGGHMANAAYWMDETSGDWTSSAFYQDSLPGWVTRFNKKQFIPFYMSRQWTTMKPIGSYKQSLADNNSYEKGFGNKQRTFPYDLNQLQFNEGPKLIRYTPFGNTYTIDFAVAAIINERLGDDNYTDLLNIALSTPGYVTERFGVRSIELEDIYLRLDKQIAHLLEVLDGRFGKENILVVLTSDRGASDNLDFFKEIGMPVGKFNSLKTVSLLESYLKVIYGRKNWVKHYSDKQIYFDQMLIDVSKLSLSEVQLKAALFLNQVKGIAQTTTSTILQSATFTSGIQQKFQNNFNPVRSGDVFISLKPGWIEESRLTKSNKLKQSSPYRYDAHVPLVFYGFNIQPTEILDEVHMNDVAPTLSNLLNIPYPSGASGKPVKIVRAKK